MSERRVNREQLRARLTADFPDYKVELPMCHCGHVSVQLIKKGLLDNEDQFSIEVGDETYTRPKIQVRTREKTTKVVYVDTGHASMNLTADDLYDAALQGVEKLEGVKRHKPN